MSTLKRRDAKAEFSGLNELWGYTVLALLKGLAGLFSGSQALLADALHSTAAAGKAFSFSIGRKGKVEQMNAKPSSEHEKVLATKLGAVIVPTILCIVIGLQLVLESTRGIIQGIVSVPHWSALIAIAVGIVIKELLFPHSERRLIASLTAMIGVGSAWLGDTFSIPFLYYADSAASIVVAVMVILNCFKFSVQGTMPSQIHNQVAAEELMQVIQRVNGVITVESLRAREHGHYVIADIVISVNPRISMAEGSEIAKRVKQLIMERFIHVTGATVHVEPYHPAYPYKTNHDPEQEQVSSLLQ